MGPSHTLGGYPPGPSVEPRLQITSLYSILNIHMEFIRNIGVLQLSATFLQATATVIYCILLEQSSGPKITKKRILAIEAQKAPRST